MRLLLSCSELGLGHVSRIIPLGKRLEKDGHQLYFYSGGKAFQLLQKEFKNVYECTPISWYETAHGINTSASLLNILFPLPLFNTEKNKLEIKSSNAMETIKRYYDLRKNIRTIPPDLLIADGDLNALRLASRWKIPSVYIANTIRPSFGFSALLNPGERFVERYVKQCAKIIIPDVAPPNTISEYSIGDLSEIGIKEKTEYVGPFMDTAYVEGNAEHIFAPISGPSGTRARLAKILLPVLEKTDTKSVVSLGIPGKKITAHMGNCTIHTWLSTQEREECMKNAKIIVFSGGHMTCFETVKYAKPSICIPTQPEQLGNAAKLRDLHCSIKVKNQKELSAAIQKIEANQEAYNSSAMKLNKFSSKFHGLDRAVEIIESLLD
jgi:UDP-N-acetylglucosamine--N-acetylmuramyl-(pentapeptide) pyrophosphoryl-undecaprenol N-acetylglucosamine transferase